MMTPPQTVLGHFLLTGIEAYQNRLWATALQHLSVALMILPNSATAKFYRGLIYERLGQFDLAQKEYLQACEDDPSYYPAWIASGKLAILSNQDYVNALKSFQTAVKLAPNNDQAQIGLAVVNLCLEAPFEETKQACQKAISLNPRNSRYYEVRAIANLQGGNCKAALEDFHVALDGCPRNLRVYWHRSYAHYVLNELDKAKQDLEYVIQEVRDAATKGLAYARLGVLYEREGELTKAFEAYDQGFGHIPTSAPVLIGRAQILTRLAQFQAALEDYDQAILLEPGRVEWVFERMQIRYWKRDFQGSLSDARIVQEKYQEQGVALYFQALCKAQLGSELEEVFRDLVKAYQSIQKSNDKEWLPQIEQAICLIESFLKASA